LKPLQCKAVYLKFKDLGTKNYPDMKRTDLTRKGLKRTDLKTLTEFTLATLAIIGIIAAMVWAAWV